MVGWFNCRCAGTTNHQLNARHVGQILGIFYSINSAKQLFPRLRRSRTYKCVCEDIDLPPEFVKLNNNRLMPIERKHGRAVYEESSEEEEVEEEVVPAMSRAQYDRLQRMRTEPLYLISVEESGHVFKVTGSTGNLYTVTVDPKATNALEVAQCNCPDARMHAKRSGVVCKHCCYVLFKALRLPAHFLSRGVPDHTLLARQMRGLLSRTWAHLSNAEYREKYSAMQGGGGGEGVAKSPFDVDESAHIEDACPICLDEMEAAECSRCPGCRNYIHQECIEIWLRAREAAHISKTCPLCRHSWERYGQVDGTKRVGEFVNLSM